MKPINIEDKIAFRLQGLGFKPTTVHRNTEKSVVTLEKFDVDFTETDEMINAAKQIQGLNVLERFIRFVLVKFSESKVFSKCCGKWATKKLVEFAKKQLVKEFCQYTPFFKISRTAHLAQKKTIKGEISGFILQKQTAEVARIASVKEPVRDFLQEAIKKPKAPKLTFPTSADIQFPVDFNNTKRAPKKAPSVAEQQEPRTRIVHSSRKHLAIV